METVKCECCGKELPKEDAFYCESGDYYICPECKDEEFTTCDRCGTLISYDEASETRYGTLCECCHDDLFG